MSANIADTEKPQSQSSGDSQSMQAVPSANPMKEVQGRMLSDGGDKFSAFHNRLIETYKTEEIPPLTFLVWFGDQVPTAVNKLFGSKKDSQQNFLNNIFLHARFNDNETVKLFVSKRLIADWDDLERKCNENRVILIDVDSQCKDYINYDLVQDYIKDKVDYVCASDTLRLSIIFHEGGKYFDTDIITQASDKETVIKSLNENLLSHEAGIRLFKHDSGIKAAKDMGMLAGIEMDMLMAVPNHILFLIFSTFVRYFSEIGKRVASEQPELYKIILSDWYLRNYFVSSTTGGGINAFSTTLLKYFKVIGKPDLMSGERNYLLDDKCKTWLQESVMGKDIRSNLDWDERARIIKAIKILFEKHIRSDPDFIDIGSKEYLILLLMIEKSQQYFPEYKSLIEKWMAPILAQQEQEIAPSNSSDIISPESSVVTNENSAATSELKEEDIIDDGNTEIPIISHDTVAIVPNTKEEKVFGKSELDKLRQDDSSQKEPKSYSHRQNVPRYGFFEEEASSKNSKIESQESEFILQLRRIILYMEVQYARLVGFNKVPPHSQKLLDEIYTAFEEFANAFTSFKTFYDTVESIQRRAEEEHRGRSLWGWLGRNESRLAYLIRDILVKKCIELEPLSSFKCH